MMAKIGRPPLDPADESVRLSFRLTTRQYDLTYKRATEARLTIGEYLRKLVDAAAKRPPR
jgi:hypothetical protein